MAFVGPVGLRAPCVVSFREKPLPLCARCPCEPTCLLPPALSRCTPPADMSLLPISACQPPDWAGVTQGGLGPTPSTPYSAPWGQTTHPSPCGRAADAATSQAPLLTPHQPSRPSLCLPSLSHSRTGPLIAIKSVSLGCSGGIKINSTTPVTDFYFHSLLTTHWMS